MSKKSTLGSAELFQRAQTYIAAGVNSGVRGTHAGWLPYPPFVHHGDGSRLYDVDGNEYIDYVMAHGPLILGHRPRVVTEAVVKAIEQYGALFSLPHELEQLVAEKVHQHMPSIELLKISNTGSEATHNAIRLARAVTGREKIIKFEGHYHGWTDVTYFSYQPPLGVLGPSSSPRTIPAAAGTPGDFARFVITQPWNDQERLARTIRDHRGEIAAIITEPIMGNTGVIPPKPGYLQFLRDITRENDILLIFDEVITGFRVSAGGAQELYGVAPDITTFAKALGGGFPIAGYGGSRSVMDLLVRGEAIHTGTYNANIVAMSAAYATLSELEKPGVYQELERISARLARGIEDVLTRAGATVQVQRVGSILQVFFSPQPIWDYRDAVRYVDNGKFSALVQAMRVRGIMIQPSSLNRWCLSTAHTDRDIDETLNALEDSAKNLNLQR